MTYASLNGMASCDLALYIFITVFLYSAIDKTATRSENAPEFLAPLENHTVTQGRDVYFTCVVNHLQSYKVAWIKSDTHAILAVNTHMVAHNPRLSVTHNGHNTWKLHVVSVQPNDSGTYMCQVNTDPMRSQTGYMTVVIPPDIMDLDDSIDRLTTMENGDVQLRCRVTGTPTPEVTWRREDSEYIILRDEYNDLQGVKVYEGEELNLTGILRQEMGSYLCIASNGVPPTVSKRYHVNVHFKPLIVMQDQIVAASVNSNATMHCYIESSPKALNTWHTENGIKLLQSERYSISEIKIKEYAWDVQMTINHVRKSDFGIYTCSAENPHGRSHSTIRLQESQESETTRMPFHFKETIIKKKQYMVEKSHKQHNSFHVDHEHLGAIARQADRDHKGSEVTMKNPRKNVKFSNFPVPSTAPANSNTAHAPNSNDTVILRRRIIRFIVHFLFVIILF